MAKENNGNIFEGLGFLGEKLAVGFMQSVEGIWDYSAGGIAKLLGNDEWAKEQFENDWFGDWYSHPDEWFNPSGGWKVAGDVAGGIGSSLPSLAAVGLITVASGGTLAPAAASLIGGAVAGLGAAGTATKEAYIQTGELGAKEFGYGALSGVTEAGIEALTAGIGVGSGRLIKAFGKSAAKESAEAVTKVGVKGVIKNFAADFASEAFEEGFAEWVSPYYKRLTYDPNAKNASAQEIAYSALVGGLSGMVMSGGHAAVGRASALVSGNKIASEGKADSTLELGRIISEFEVQNKTGDEVLADAADVYARLTASLEGTGGQVKTAGQKMMLSDLRRTSTAAIFGPLMKRNAEFVALNAPAVAERLSSYYTDASGKAMNITAEQLMAGLELDKNGRISTKSYYNAMKNNEALRTVVAQLSAGRLMMDADRFAMSAAEGNAIVTDRDLVLFKEASSDSQFSAVSEALGIDLVSSDADTVNSIIKNMDGEARSRLYATAKAINEVKNIPDSAVKGKIPIAITMKADGSARYSDGEIKIAITKDGDSYYIYDYATGNRTKALTKEEANKLLRQYRAEKVAADQAVREGKTVNTKTAKETERAKQAREIDELLRKEVKDYSALSDGNKAMVRQVYRTALAKGISIEDALVYARVSSRSGVDIRFNRDKLLLGRSAKTKKLVYADGVYSYDRNAIYINPEGTRTNEQLLIHELAHAIYKDKKGKLIAEKGVKNMSEKEKKRIRDDYAGEIAKDSSVEPDELNAHYAEGLLGDKYCLERILSEEPSIKEKILSFFKRVSGDESVPKLSAEAKRLLKKYKKLFDSFAEQNRNNASSEEIWTRESTNDQKYLINRTVDDKPFVIVTDNILDGIAEADWVSTVKQNLATKYPNGVVVGNSDIRIDAKSRKEMTFSKYMQWVHKNDPSIYADKLKATNNVDEILKATTDWVGEALLHPRNDDIIEFARGNVLLRVGNNDYTAEVVVGTRKNGQLRLYDVLYLTPTQIKQKKTSKAIPANPSPEAKRKTSEIFNISIPENTEKVNGFGEKSFDKGEKKSGSGKRWAYAGDKSETADTSLLERAKAMEAEGAESEAIRKETGWFKGDDGNWRYEIDDSEMVALPYDVENTETTLDKLIKHDKLFNAYPQLRKLKVIIDTDFGVSALYSPSKKHIKIRPVIFRNGKLGIRGLNTLIHEIQHAIQDIEGFEGGTSPNYWFQKFKSAETDEYIELGLERDDIYDEVIQKKGIVAYDCLKRYFEIKDEIRELNNQMSELVGSSPDGYQEFSEAKKELENERYDIEDQIELFDLNKYFIELLYIDNRRSEISKPYVKTYKRSAGEREAYDTQERRDFSEAKRRDTMPDIQKEDTIFLKDTDKIVQEIIDQSGGTISRRESPVESEAMISNNDARWALPERDESGVWLSEEQRTFFKYTKVVSDLGYLLPVGKLHNKGGATWVSDNVKSDEATFYAKLENPVEVGNLDNSAFSIQKGNRLPSNGVKKIAKQLGCKPNEIMPIVLRGNCKTIRDLVSQKEFVELCKRYGKDGFTAFTRNSYDHEDIQISFAVFSKGQLKNVNIKSPKTHKNNLTQTATQGYNKIKTIWEILTDDEQAQLYSRNAGKEYLSNSERLLPNGDYLLDINNKLVETNGDPEYPTIDSIVEFNAFSRKITEARIFIYEFINNGRTIRESVDYVNALCKEKVATLYLPSNLQYNRGFQGQGQNNGQNRGNTVNGGNRGRSSTKNKSTLSVPQRQGNKRYALPEGGDGEEISGYNDTDEIFTAKIPEYARFVAKEDRDSFNRALSNQTREIAKNSSRTIQINCGKYTYFFEATGYMRGTPLKRIHNRFINIIKKARRNFNVRDDSYTNNADLWSEFVSDIGGHASGNISGTGYGDTTSGDDRLFSEKSNGDGAGYTQSSWSDIEEDKGVKPSIAPLDIPSWEEIIERIKANLDKHGIKYRKDDSSDGNKRFAVPEGIKSDDITPIEALKMIDEQKISVSQKKKQAVEVQQKIEERMKAVEKLDAKKKALDDSDASLSERISKQIENIEKEITSLRDEYKAIYVSLGGSTRSSVTTEKRDEYDGGTKDKLKDIKLATEIAVVNEYAGMETYLRDSGFPAREAEKIAEQSRKSANMGAFAAGVVQFDPADFDREIYTVKEWVEKTKSNGKKYKVYEDVPYFKDTKERVLPKGKGILQIFNNTKSILKKKYGFSKTVATEYFSDYLLNLHNISRMSLNEASVAERSLIEDRLTAAKKERNKAKRRLAPYKSKVESAASTLRVFQDKLKLTKNKDGALAKLVERYQQELREAKEAARSFEAEVKEADKKVKAIEEELKAFVPEENKPVFGKNEDRGRDHAVTADESKQIVKWYEQNYPELVEAGKEVHNFFRNILRLSVYSGSITEESYQYFVKKYPYYIPTDRLDRHPTIAAVKGKNNVEVKSTIRRAEGGGGDIAPLLETATERAVQAYRTAFANRMANAIYEGYLRTGDTKEVKVLEREIVRSINPDETPDKPKINQVTFYRSGEKITMQVTPSIFSAFKSINETTSYNNAVAIVLKKMMGFFKALVTDLNPLFTVSNIVKDRFDAVYHTKHLGKWFKNAITFRGAKNILGNSTIWQLNLATGGMASSIYDSEKGYTAYLTKAGFKKTHLNSKDSKFKNFAKGSLGWFLNSVSNANAMVEQSTRILEFQATLESGGTIYDAMLDAAEVTTNFGRKGSVAKHFNTLFVPFLNAQIQGISRSYRDVKDALKKGWSGVVRLLLMAAVFGITPQVLNQLMLDDDEEYKELRDSDKQNYFIFRIGETLVKIPKGRVMSAYAGAVVQSFNAKNGESVDLKGYVESLFSTFTPAEAVQRNILSPFTDVKNNLTWYGSAIEGAQFDNTQPKDRYDENTSSIAIAIGQLINYSPKKIHYLIDQYSGVIGDVILPLTTLGAERGIVESKFTIDATTQNKLSSEFYKLYDEAQYARTAGDENAVYQVLYLNRVKSEISDLFEQKQKIQASKELSDYEKLQQTRVIQALISEVYRTALNEYELINTAISATEGLGYSSADATEKKLRYTEIVHIAYGAERALAEYNADVYSKMQVLNKGGIDYESLYAYYFATKGIESDTDKKGNAVSGSKRRKVLAAINGLNLRAEQKLLLICAKGYSLQDGDIRGVSAENAKRRLLKYITSLNGVSAAEKAEIAKMCGFTVKNGRIILK